MHKMIALTLVDHNKENPHPWLTRVEAGDKTKESRTWQPKTFQGKKLVFPFDLLLCGSASSKTDNRGVACCVVTITGVEKFKKEDEQAVGCQQFDGYVWNIANLRWLSRKFPVKGTQQLFEVEIPADVQIIEPDPRKQLGLRDWVNATYKLREFAEPGTPEADGIFAFRFPA